MATTGNATGQSWTAVTIARERPEVMKRFISWHLDAGAQEVIVYFDDPEDPMVEQVADLPQVRPVRCTPRFWRRLRIAPARPFVKRQNVAFRHAYVNCKTDWLLVIDADELLWLRDGKLSDFLAVQPPEIRSVLFRPAERITVRDSEEFAFRTEMPLETLMAHYGPQLGAALKGRRGLVGHLLGKSVHRTGQTNIRMRQHFLEDSAAKRIIDKTVTWEEGAALLHLMNNDYEIWRQKLHFRLVTASLPRRMGVLIASLLEAGDEAAIREYFRMLFEITPDGLARLEAANAAHRAPIDPDHAVSKYFPES